MHLAAALGTPVVPVFGPGTPRQTAPLVGPDLCRPVTLAFPCSPCRQDFFRECAKGPGGKPCCLEDLHVERVVEAAEGILERG
jgi:ADP-heptose:LPS heptosyltransferase